MSWKSIWQSILIHLIVGLICGLIGFFIGRGNKPLPEYIDLTDKQRKEIVQSARLGYITLDSAKTLIQQESKISWIVKDSIVIKDSLNIKDSVVTVYIPIYESRDSLIVLLDSLEYLIEIGLRQRFFPLQKKFASSIWLNRFRAPEINEIQEDSFFKNRFILYFGYGLSGDNKGIRPNFQLGCGFRIW